MIEKKQTGTEIAIDNLKTELNEVRTLLSEKRKEGYDTAIAEFEIGNIPSKIQMAEATGEREDIQYANEKLKRVKDELETCIKKDATLSYEEIMNGGEQSKENETMSKVRVLIKTAAEALQSGDSRKAYSCYIHLRGIYKFVPQKMKRLVYHRTVEIHNALSTK